MSRYEKEDLHEILLLKIELQDKKQSITSLCREIEETIDPFKKIQKSFELLKKTPSLSDAIFVLSLQLKDSKLEETCSEKIRILKIRKQKYLDDLLSLQ